MPHLVIIVDIEAALEQIDTYHEQITNNIVAEMYEGKQLEEAQSLLTNTESLLSTTKASLETQVGNLETFLGI
jgi:hypothetical protein